MLAYSISNENITDYFIYFPESNFIYSPRATYSTELFYEHRYFFEEGFEVFKQTLSNFYTGKFLPIFLHDYTSNKNYLVYARTFSGYKPGSIIANAFIIFDLSVDIDNEGFETGSDNGFHIKFDSWAAALLRIK